MLESELGSDTSPPRRGNRAGLRLAGASLVWCLALSAPLEEGGPLCMGDEPSPALANGGPELSTLPAGWPNPAPELKTEHESRIWSLVWSSCVRYSLTHQALAMYHVLWEESRLLPHVRSACGRYLGIGQFVPSTFRSNVNEMKRRGLIPRDADFSPYDPDHAIEVMAFMWSQGFSNHWGPYRRVARRLARSAPPAPAAPVALASNEPVN